MSMIHEEYAAFTLHLDPGEEGWPTISEFCDRAGLDRAVTVVRARRDVRPLRDPEADANRRD